MLTTADERGWEPHKEAIRTLYLSEGRPLPALRNEMKTRYGFDKSKAQYERIFKKWGFKKYRSEEDWASIGYFVKKRKRATVVWLDDDKPVPAKRLRKQLKRYEPSISRISCSGQSPILPPGVIIRSPSPGNATPDFADSGFSHSVTLPSSRGATEKSPIQLFRNQIAMRASSTPLSFSLDSSLSSLPVFELFSQLEDSMRSCLVADFFNSLPDNIRHALQYNVAITSPQSSAAVLPHSRLQALWPEHDEGLELLKLAVMLASNNMLGHSSEFNYVASGLLQQEYQHDLLEHLVSMKGATAEALVENLFRHAMDTEDITTIRYLIRGGLKPNEVLVGSPGYRKTPLEAACLKQNDQLIRTLVDAGCDLSSTRSKRYALSDYMYWLGGGDIEIDTVRLLLKLGADVNDDGQCSPLCWAALRGSLDVVELLIAEGADPNFRSLKDGVTPIGNALVSYRDPTIILNIVKALIKAGADINAPRHDPWRNTSVSTMELAVHIWALGNLDIIQFLLSAGDRPDEQALNEVVGYKDIEVIQLFVKAGAPITSRTFERAFDSHAGSPRSISDGHLVDILLEHGKDESDKSRRRVDAFVAAISSGKEDYIEMFEAENIRLVGSPTLVEAIENATQCHYKRVLELLLDPESENRSVIHDNLGESLNIAFHSHHWEMVDLLLTAGATFDSQGGFEAVSEAIRLKDPDLIKNLLVARARVNMSGSNPPSSSAIVLSVLPLAVKWDYPPIIVELIAAGADLDGVMPGPIDPEGDQLYLSSLSVAVQNRNYTLVDRLVAAGADINCHIAYHDVLTPLRAALCERDPKMVEHLLYLGADPGDELVLCYAIQGGEELLTQVLIAASNRSPPCAKNVFTRALKAAIELKQIRMADMLLSAGANPDKIMCTPLSRLSGSAFGSTKSCLGAAICCLTDCALEFVSMLLGRGANPNGITRDNPKKTALMDAISIDNVEVVRLLIDHGANVNTNATYGFTCTPLQLTAKHGNFEMVKELLIRSAEVNAPPSVSHGATALQFAAMGGYLGVAKLLLDNNADVNAAPAKIGGRTALEAAAEHGRLDMVQLLINWGATVIGPGEQPYKRSLMFAKDNGHMAIARLLERYHDVSETFLGHCDSPFPGDLLNLDWEV